MKNIKILLFFIVITSANSQTLTAIFSHKIKYNDSIIPTKPSLYKYINSSEKSIYKLFETESFKSDSVVNDKTEMIEIAINYSASKNERYKDLRKRTFLQEYRLFDIDFSIKDNLLNFEWELFDEKQIIRGYNCKKAISNIKKNKITAWYCEDIPVNDGPDRFQGLPGFILKVEIAESTIIELVQIKLLNEKIKIEQPQNKSKYLTMAEFVKEEIALFNKKSNEN